MASFSSACLPGATPIVSTPLASKQDWYTYKNQQSDKAGFTNKMASFMVKFNISKIEVKRYMNYHFFTHSIK